MRYQLYDKNKTINGIDIYDILNLPWKEFKFSNGYKKYVINEVESYQPWMISYNEFGTVDYEDIIMRINNVKNVLDLTPGQELLIPTIEDLQNFIRRYRN